jgi:hypothetical protein
LSTTTASTSKMSTRQRMVSANEHENY